MGVGVGVESSRVKKPTRHRSPTTPKGPNLPSGKRTTQCPLIEIRACFNVLFSFLTLQPSALNEFFFVIWTISARLRK